ncbi:hypothetical protein [Candidatus Thiothrix anitrata]|uniref:Uncharacterized protein n=1 Tax=Candidatus Thiothrix anitrata TaxID=2823902 RepID=A0ABX7WZ97_9GAMM|nr:hypothetical protein [Candidatus Thiothrix anitrata]QTR48965.1 hypothetical protein J8380_11840 [Candidatus Thiothrix anitrata]
MHVLESYLLKYETYSKLPPASNANQKLINAIVNFNKILVDLINQCNLYKNKYDIRTNTYTYWVDNDHLPYHERGDYLEYKKGVLRSLFYYLIKSANYIIQIWNSDVPNKGNYKNLIGYIEEFNYNFPLIGNPQPSPEFYPSYTDEEINEFGLYPGLQVIDKWIKDQIYPS